MKKKRGASRSNAVATPKSSSLTMKKGQSQMEPARRNTTISRKDSDNNSVSSPTSPQKKKTKSMAITGGGVGNIPGNTEFEFKNLVTESGLMPELMLSEKDEVEESDSVISGADELDRALHESA